MVGVHSYLPAQGLVTKPVLERDMQSLHRGCYVIATVPGRVFLTPAVRHADAGGGVLFSLRYASK